MFGTHLHRRPSRSLSAFSSADRLAPRGLTNRMLGPQPAGSAKPGASSSHSRVPSSGDGARSASVGHAAMHAGLCAGVPAPAGATLGRSARPALSCRQKSHFVITPADASYRGAPNGQAISQYRHPMHRAA
jgi:hypothetical protein